MGVSHRDFLQDYKMVANFCYHFHFRFGKTHDLTLLSIVCYTFEFFHKD